ncbi:PAS domain-containing protein [Algihabitans albus]|uniref:PAS domain-containing protein n=1 Tax=Algihabitans albus TaxID=2164067 RepID=UPI0035CED688
MAQDLHLTGNEVFFDEDEIIVSKTDLKGRITYCNDVFLRVAGYSERELLGQPHNIVRHPDMPRCVYKLLWDTLAAGREIFAYVVNRARNGDHYWVLAHVTPSRDKHKQVIGYHSSRRVPDRGVVTEKIVPLYRSLLAVEQKQGNRKEGMLEAFRTVAALLEESGVDYDEFVWRLKAA